MLSLFQSLPDALHVAAASLLLLVGAGLCGYSRHYRFTVEERVRLGQLKPADAGRAIAYFRWSGPTLTAFSATLLLVACWNSGR